ncbi:MAG: helix-turn-helix domain-containing protein [Synergistaceae bacterium]|jgi:transcriptional regulator with XRE-family HTH domain|nr:helix-turn-helix domain-containing protein [Synergistaceae bacterium]
MISDNLRHIRKEICKLSQSKVSELTGIPQTTWSCWEHGIGEPTATQAALIAKVFNVPLETLLETREPL